MSTSFSQWIRTVKQLRSGVSDSTDTATSASPASQGTRDVQPSGPRTSTSELDSATIASGARVKVQNLQNKPELNGCEGDCIKMLDSGRWEVRLVTGEVLAFKPANLDIQQQVNRIYNTKPSAQQLRKSRTPAGRKVTFSDAHEEIDAVAPATTTNASSQPPNASAMPPVDSTPDGAMTPGRKVAYCPMPLKRLEMYSWPSMGSFLFVPPPPPSRAMSFASVFSRHTSRQTVGGGSD